MHVCVLTTALDIFKGGNHLPLFASLPDISFTILTHRLFPASAVLPPNVKVHCLSGRGGPYYFGMADARFAQDVLRTYPPSHAFWQAFDLIHLNQTLHPSLLGLQQSERPVLYFVHHPVTADRAVAIQESGFWTGMLWRLKYALLIRWQRKICRRAQCIVTVSSTVRERLSQDYRCDREKIFVVPNGVDASLFTEQSEQDPLFDAIAVGSFLHPRKGFPYLLNVYGSLAAQGKKIADVGKRSYEQRMLLQKIPGVTVFGTVDAATIIALMQQSSVLLSTSLYEGFGLSLIEALACGRPAFAFDGGAVREVLEHFDAHLIISLRDSTEMIRRVLAYLSLSQEKRAATGQRYRRAVIQQYTLEKAAEMLRGTYERMLHREGKKDGS